MRVCAFFVLIIWLHGGDSERRSLRRKREALNIIYNNDCKYQERLFYIVLTVTNTSFSRYLKQYN